MVDFLTNQQIDEFRRIFNLFDKDGDGTILTSNLGQVMRCLGLNPTEKELAQYISESDVNCDGVLEFEGEFLPLMATKCKDIDDEEDLVEAFKPFDRDNSGYVYITEFRHLMKTLGEQLPDEEVDHMLQLIGCDTEGRIDYKEFIRMCLSNCDVYH
uniref:Calmodulin n=1 Tax=Alexandrium monilatum TaxID=311494 RepID=A0A7S4UGR5_9DINO|mmetsp:Transcript_71812/g.214406  ORF Transcript_71812/g.214406 Transcript_71812/m.214406 type:complete len:156 (-) Transcript_71812:163-630(-)